MSLLLLVLSIIYSFHFFESQSFIRAESQTIVQENIVRAAQFITDEIRNAVELSLEDSYTEMPGYCTIFVEDSVLKYYDGSGTIVDKTEAVIDRFQVELEEKGSQYSVNFHIGGLYQSQYYDITTGVVLNNLENAQPASGKSVIRYKKP